MKMLNLNPRLFYGLLIILTIFLGLFSRTKFIPEWIYPYLGDILYALMFYWIFALFYPKKNPIIILCLGVGTCFLIEVSQLYQDHWLEFYLDYKLRILSGTL